MKQKLSILAACVATAAVAGGGAALAHDDPYRSTPKRSARQGPASEDLSPSRLARAAYLTGAAEIGKDNRPDAGDPTAKGAASLLQVSARTVCYGFSVTGTDEPTNVHVHRAPAGRNGPVVIDFSKGIPKDAQGRASGNPGASSGCKTLTSQGEIAALRRIRLNPKGYYVNVHTKAFPDGAVRGQLAAVWFDNTR